MYLCYLFVISYLVNLFDIFDKYFATDYYDKIVHSAFI